MAEKPLASRVLDILMYCMYEDQELPDGKPPPDAVIASAITQNFGFHPGRLAEMKPKIKELLEEMPGEFHANDGGGGSFLNLCMDKNGEQWGEHRNMQELVALGLATGMVRFRFSRELWPKMPGGVPYLTIDTSK